SPLRTLKQATFPAADVANLLAGNTYVNIHTPSFPGGEIRGQLVIVAGPNSATGTGGISGIDNVTGGQAADVLMGNDNPNKISGGPGGDLLIGRAGADVIHGDAGDDTLVGDGGGDQLFGDADNDIFVWNNGDGTDTVDGGGGFNMEIVNGSATAGDDFSI